MTQRSKKLLTLLATAGALGAAAVPVAQARHGADDPVGHDRGDDHGGLRAGKASHGADDPANHDANDDRRVGGRRVEAVHHHRHRGRDRARDARRGGRDDGPNHDAGDDRGPR
jgi:hypothetical protein